MKPSDTAYISHPDCLLHEMGAYHPECPARLSAINDQLISSGLMNFLLHFDAPCATDEQLERVHSKRYISGLASIAPSTGLIDLDPDTAMCAHTLRAARRAAGASVLATDLVIEGTVANAFCAVRPPGHHAGKQSAMGFCFFNNVAVGVAHALEHHGLQRVAVVDFDVHHGNGTEEIFRDDTRVMMVSIFQHPFYPFTGLEHRCDRFIDIPFAPYTGGEEIRDAIRTQWLPALTAFAPEMIFFSAGFDAHREDELASLRLVEADYFWITEAVKEIAERYSEGRMVSVLEGGYALHALGRSVVAHIKALGNL